MLVRENNLKPVIFFDQDEVLNYFSKAIIERYNKDFDDNINWLDISSYGWTETKAPKEYFERILREPGTFLNIEPNYDGIRTFKKLMDLGYDVRIITKPTNSKYCIPEKIEWLKKYMPFVDLSKVYFLAEKYLLSASNHILLDDYIDNLKAWRRYGGIAVAYDQKWNKEWNGLRVYSHDEFFELIMTQQFEAA